MAIRDRIVAIITLIFLNVAVAGAAGAVVKLTPPRELAPRAAEVAARTPLAPAPPGIHGSGMAGPLPSSLGSRLGGLILPYINAVVIDPASGSVLYDARAAQGAVPASTNKLATATAALETLGPDTRLTTKVVRDPTTGDAVLVGGGDPTVAGPWMTPARLAAAYPRPASIVDLAQQTATALKAARITQIRVDYDASMFSGPATAPGWSPGTLNSDVATIGSLELDEGLTDPASAMTDGLMDADGHDRVGDPAAGAAHTFVSLLQHDGISATLGARTTTAPTAPQLAAVQSPPVSALVESMLTVSDNDMAEHLARLVGVRLGQPGTFAGGAQGVHEALARLGLADGVQTFDGSGLSHSDHITPMALARIIATAASPAHPELRAVITGMPIAGFTGTLSNRYGTPSTEAGAGMVRAKTGTVDNVNTLAGLAYDQHGRLLAFAFMANEPSEGDATAALAAIDQMAAALATC